MTISATSTKVDQAGWLDAMVAVARHYGLSPSKENVQHALAWEREAPDEQLLAHMARQVGLALHISDSVKDTHFSSWDLPVVLEIDDGSVCVVKASDGHGQLGVQLSGDQGLETKVAESKLSGHIRKIAILRPLQSVPDARVDEYIKPYRPNWFNALALKEWKRYIDVMLASLVANVLALAGILFSMQIYDRVIPAQSTPTLWVLFSGVIIAVLFELALRLMRTYLTDLVGKRADLRISDVVFGHALRTRQDAISKSTGSFIAQIRELEQVRELMTSTTVNAIADLPFFFLFMFIMWILAGPIMFVSLLAAVLLIIPGWLAQKPLARLANEGMRESALRNAMLVEAAQGIEDIKLLRAEPRFENKWNLANDISAKISMDQRWWVSLLMTWTQEIQNLMYAIVVAVGSILVMKGDMTTGALVGASILSSRMIAPLAQVSGLFARWQQAKVARKGIDELMQRPVDQPEQQTRVHRASLRGDYVIERLLFQYGKDDRAPALAIQKLTIQAGEKVAVLGRIGAGKSTLLRILAGLIPPQDGHILLDGVELRSLDPSDVRRDMTLLSQDAHLFYGTIRENLIMGAPTADDAALGEALHLSGALPFVQSRSMGLDNIIFEGGMGLSGGQRQSMLLARTVLSDPQIVLLDEPTASLDEASERYVIDNLKRWLGARTLIVSTHRASLLALVDRIIVIDGGRIVMDGPKEQVLGTLTK
jgi:ATP-binding cassette subfamily C protein LapB